MSFIIIASVVAAALLYIALVRGYIAGLIFLSMALPGTVWHKIKQTILAIGDMLGLIRYNERMANKGGVDEYDFHD